MIRRRCALLIAAPLLVLLGACQYVRPHAGNPLTAEVGEVATFCWDVRSESFSTFLTSWDDGSVGDSFTLAATPSIPFQGELCDAHRWSREGTFVVDGRLVAEDLGSIVDTATIVVGDPDPIVVHPTAVRGTLLGVDATGAVVGVGGDPHTAVLDWDFGDGVVVTGRGRIVNHVWEVPRTYDVTVTIHDAGGTVLGAVSQPVVVGNR